MSGDAAVAAALRDIQASPLRPSSRSLGTTRRRAARRPRDTSFPHGNAVVSALSRIVRSASVEFDHPGARFALECGRLAPQLAPLPQQTSYEPGEAPSEPSRRSANARSRSK